MPPPAPLAPGLRTDGPISLCVDTTVRRPQGQRQMCTLSCTDEVLGAAFGRGVVLGPTCLTAAMGIWTQADRKLDAGGHEI